MNTEAEFREQRLAMFWSLGIAVVLLIIKLIAAVMTSSSAIYSDAAESVVHLCAVLFAVWALHLAHKPADDNHDFGHDKITYVSAGFEGAMIIVAAMFIFYEAVKQCFAGPEIKSLGIGIVLTVVAMSLNLVLGYSLIRIGKKSGSALLRANGMHVLTDVWSSLAVLIALVLMKATGWKWWDPIAAMLAALNIVRTGFGLVKESLGGLLDEGDLKVKQQVEGILTQACNERHLSFHNLRYRHSGRTHWVEFHICFSDDANVRDAHDQVTEIEQMIAQALKPECRVISHLEPQSAEHAAEIWEKK